MFVRRINPGQNFSAKYFFVQTIKNDFNMYYIYINEYNNQKD